MPIWPIYSQVSLWCSFSRCCLFGHWERIWKSWAPAKCRFFLWFVAHNQCWTTDGLAQQGLNHPKHEAIQHVLVSSFCLPNLVLRTESGPHHPFSSSKAEFIWWQVVQSSFSCVYPKKKVASAVSGPTQQGLNSLIILGAWILWKHRDDCVLIGVTISPRPSPLLVRRPSSGVWQDLRGYLSSQPLVWVTRLLGWVALLQFYRHEFNLFSLGGRGVCNSLLCSTPAWPRIKKHQLHPS